MITVLLVDNDPQVLAGLEMLLALEPGLTVIGSATTVTVGMELARSLRPDIVVMDVRLPDGDGIAATHALRTELPYTRIIILSLYADPETRQAAQQAGAAAFVSKHDLSDAVLAAIRALTSDARPPEP